MGNKYSTPFKGETYQQENEDATSTNKHKNTVRLANFKIKKLIGEGTYGQVFLVKYKQDSRPYAMKAVKKTLTLDAPDGVEHLMLERDVLCLGSESPFIVQLFCTIQTKNHLFYIMEFLSGGDLYYHVNNSKGFNENWIRFYAVEIACGLQFLHRNGVIHRDLKLTNILISIDGHCKLADFGLCKRLPVNESAFLGICGTIDHLAPEMLQGRAYNCGVDWWAFGIILYEILTKINLFYGQSIVEVFNSIQFKLYNDNDEKLEYPYWVTREARSCIEALLQIDCKKRLGMPTCPLGPIRNHPFFSSVDWDKIEKQEIEPPFKPYLDSEFDTTYFEKEFTNKSAELSKVDEILMEMVDETLFDDFSLINDNFKQNF